MKQLIQGHSAHGGDRTGRLTLLPKPMLLITTRQHCLEGRRRKGRKRQDLMIMNEEEKKQRYYGQKGWEGSREEMIRTTR